MLNAAQNVRPANVGVIRILRQIGAMACGHSEGLRRMCRKPDHGAAKPS